ncbi:MAG: HAD-IIIA family hydrolase [Niastella sp.]|nr:HAD-IIIA family hydrolase [Niastella sp.]
MNRAVFLGKDGTYNVPCETEPSLITLDAYVIEALQQLHQQDYMMFMITNQPGIAFGCFSEADLHTVFIQTNKKLKEHGTRLQGLYYCPHHHQGKQWPYNTTCHCHKPRPAMLRRAAEEYNIDMLESWMIGETLDDMEAGNQAGCKTILIDNGKEIQWNGEELRKPDHTAANLLEAAEFITRRTRYSRFVEQL